MITLNSNRKIQPIFLFGVRKKNSNVLYMSVYCKYIINLYNKHKFKCGDTVYNEKDYVHRCTQTQIPDVIYLYKFSNDNRYLSVLDNNISVIEKVENTVLLEILWHIYGPKKSKEELISNIIKNYNIVTKNCPTPILLAQNMIHPINLLRICSILRLIYHQQQ